MYTGAVDADVFFFILNMLNKSSQIIIRQTQIIKFLHVFENLNCDSSRIIYENEKLCNNRHLFKKRQRYSKSYKVFFFNQHKCLNTGEVWFVFWGWSVVYIKGHLYIVYM